jgi:hypothetical protein
MKTTLAACILAIALVVPGLPKMARKRGAMPTKLS